MGDHALATANFDRMLQYAHVVNIHGGSYRRKAHTKTGLCAGKLH